MFEEICKTLCSLVTGALLGGMAALLALVMLSGCSKSPITAWTEGYQKAVFGYTLEPHTPCPKGQQWVQGICKPKKGGAS